MLCSGCVGCRWETNDGHQLHHRGGRATASPSRGQAQHHFSAGRRQWRQRTKRKVKAGNMMCRGHDGRLSGKTRQPVGACDGSGPVSVARFSFCRRYLRHEWRKRHVRQGVRLRGFRSQHRRSQVLKPLRYPYVPCHVSQNLYAEAVVARRDPVPWCYRCCARSHFDHPLRDPCTHD